MCAFVFPVRALWVHRIRVWSDSMCFPKSITTMAPVVHTKFFVFGRVKKSRVKSFRFVGASLGHCVNLLFMLLKFHITLCVLGGGGSFFRRGVAGVSLFYLLSAVMRRGPGYGPFWHFELFSLSELFRSVFWLNLFLSWLVGWRRRRGAAPIWHWRRGSLLIQVQGVLWKEEGKKPWISWHRCFHAENCSLVRRCFYRFLSSCNNFACKNVWFLLWVLLQLMCSRVTECVTVTGDLCTLLNYVGKRDMLHVFESSFQSSLCLSFTKDEEDEQDDVQKRGTFGRKSKPPKSPISPKKKSPKKKVKTKKPRKGLKVSHTVVQEMYQAFELS